MLDSMAKHAAVGARGLEEGALSVEAMNGWRSA
jgi:hypothetical protein